MRPSFKAVGSSEVTNCKAGVCVDMQGSVKVNLDAIGHRGVNENNSASNGIMKSKAGCCEALQKSMRINLAAIRVIEGVI